jgi:oxygen-independent coproporphyrinogen-3 oxidase
MNPLAIYVHIPFCTVKCGYCDFNAYSGMDALKSRYAAAVLAELDYWRGDVARHTVSSIAFGGGTPGEQPPEDIARIIEAVHAAAPALPGIEVSLEANPGTSNAGHFRALHEAGVTRLSLGAQSFHAAELRALDRIHSVEAIGASFRTARLAGFASVNLDLIYGLPGSTVESWLHSIRAALALRPDHLSLYALTVEDGTPLAAAVAAGRVQVPGPDEVADQYEAAWETLAREGFEQYELSNWARPGHQSRHNRTYWEYGEYLGLGAGAHSFFEDERLENIAHPRDYIAAASGGGGATASRYVPDKTTAIIDWLALRLRLLEGFHRDEFRAAFAIDLDVVAPDPLVAAITAGILEYAGGVVRLSTRGRMLHGELVARVLAYLQVHPERLGGVAMAARC